MSEVTIPEAPISRIEQYFNYLATGDGALPEYPISRKEQYLAYLCAHRSDGAISILNKNGEVITTTAANVQTTATQYIVTNYGRQPKTLDGLVLTITDAGNDKVLYVYSSTSSAWVNIGVDVDLSQYFTKAETNALLAEKVKIQQGAENAGKVLGVTNDGTVAPVDDSGGILPILVVTAATGSTVTISRNGTTLTATEASGTWTFNPTSLGVWTITVVNDGGTVTSSIDIKTVKEYAIQVFNSPVYGIRRQLASSSPAWERTDNAIGLTFTPTIGTETGSSGFDTVAPWKDIHRTTIGTDVMVEIPNFYVKRYQEDGYEYIKVCATQNSGFVPAVSYSGGTPEKFYVGAYKTVSGHASKSGYNPLTNLTRASFRSGATGKGGGWSLIDAQVVSAVNILMLVETASYNSQGVIGRGYCDGHSAAIATGSCDGIVSGRPAGTDGSTDIVYRYIEGWWGNVWEWFDGINWQDGKYYFCNTRTSYADDTSANYVQLGFNGQTNWSSSYLKTFGCDANYPTVMLPNAVGASDSTFSCDGSWSNTGWRVVRRGGDWADGSSGGAFAFSATYVSSAANANSGSRLLYISP